ncbi:wxcX [Symbiodinium sp. CCMP2592]|nr:wxcX [Symbiodinium sp. CCMP2592]
MSFKEGWVGLGISPMIRMTSRFYGHDGRVSFLALSLRLSAWEREETAAMKLFTALLALCVAQSHQTEASADDFTEPEVLMEKIGFHSGKIGIFAQVGSAEVWPELAQCVSNVLEASDDSIGVHIDYVEASAPTKAAMHQLWGYLRGKHGFVNLLLTKSKSKGMDMGHFVSQLYTAQKKGLQYDLMLKIHTDSHPDLRKLAMEALCGTKFQVRSALHNFEAHGKLNLIAPAGTTMTRRTKTANLAPALSERLFGGRAEVGGAPMYSTKQATKLLLKEMGANIDIAEDQLTSIGGNMYWARFNSVPFPNLAASASTIWPKLEGIETELGNFAVSSIRGAGYYVGELPMAPKVMAIYFPQYHQFPENDEFHGEGFTEWTHLKPFVDEANELRKPLAAELGGLDYYDLTDRKVRKHQADLAKQYGVHGFMFYHYWFSGQGVKNSSVMWKIPHMMLQDGQPDMPFFFSWANRRWERGYGEHATGEVLIDQDYSNESGWKEHFEYLLPYFQHRLYKKVDNKPIFAIYFPQEIGDKLGPMMNNWHQLAKQNGFNGIYFLRTVSGAGGPQFMPSLFDASFHFMAVCERCGRPASGEDKDFVTTWPQYWGATTGFDNRVRGCSQRYRASPEEFKVALQQSFSNMSHHPARRINENLYFVAAWNEWNEQGVLEPDAIHAFAYLQALQHAAETIGAADPTSEDLLSVAAPVKKQRPMTSLLEMKSIEVRPDLAWGHGTGPKKWDETRRDRKVDPKENPEPQVTLGGDAKRPIDDRLTTTEAQRTMARAASAHVEETTATTSAETKEAAMAGMMLMIAHVPDVEIVETTVAEVTIAVEVAMMVAEVTTTTAEVAMMLAEVTTAVEVAMTGATAHGTMIVVEVVMMVAEEVTTAAEVATTVAVAMIVATARGTMIDVEVAMMVAEVTTAVEVAMTEAAARETMIDVGVVMMVAEVMTVVEAAEVTTTVAVAEVTMTVVEAQPGDWDWEYVPI